MPRKSSRANSSKTASANARKNKSRSQFTGEAQPKRDNQRRFKIRHGKAYIFPMPLSEEVARRILRQTPEYSLESVA